MDSNIWFELKYRDKAHKKYRACVYKLHQMDHSYSVAIDILSDDNRTATFKIEFSETWIKKFAEFDKFRDIITTESGSPLIENVLRDFLPGKKLEELNNASSLFHTDSVYSKNVFLNANRILDYKRDPVIVAKENKLAREIVLRELYFIQSSRGASSVNYVVENCNFYNHVIRNAIDALKLYKVVTQMHSELLCRANLKPYVLEL